jgi:uncharacterized protein (DUF2237 family)
MPVSDTAQSAQESKNVLGGPLECCCTDPVTGFARDGYCKVTSSDYGVHAVCAQVTEEFLEFTKTRGNDLSTPRPPGFPGLKPGDKWCLCASRWKEAYENGVAPKVVLASTDAKALEYIPLEVLQQHAA